MHLTSVRKPITSVLGALGLGCLVLGLTSPVQDSPKLGGPLPGLTSSEESSFFSGQRSFTKVRVPETGLGPVFNGQSCSECHSAGAIGGAATNNEAARVARIGGLVGGKYSDLVSEGGPMIQARSVKEFTPTSTVAPEAIPASAKFVSHRIPTPLFGAGLIEAIPNAEILKNAQAPQPDGIQGVVHYVTDPMGGNREIGRFGWKAQISNLELFAFDAYINEMGITTPFFPREVLPQGKPIPRGADDIRDPEDFREGPKIAHFTRLLAAPTQGPDTEVSRAGEAIFARIKCSSCHVPSMTTGPTGPAAFRSKTVNLYSDLLLHRMGKSLDDGVQQGDAKGDQWRTAPLWGLSARQFFLHDGRATTLSEAILTHGGEAQATRDRFAALPKAERDALIAFLMRL